MKKKKKNINDSSDTKIYARKSELQHMKNADADNPNRKKYRLIKKIL